MEYQSEINETILDYDETKLADAVVAAKYYILNMYEQGFAGRSHKDFLERHCGDFALALHNIFRGKSLIYNNSYHAVVKIGDKFYDANPYDITPEILPLINKEFFPDDLDTKEGRDYFEMFMDSCHKFMTKEEIVKFEEEMKMIEEKVKETLGYTYTETLKR